MALLVTDFIQLKLDQTLTLIPVLPAFYSIIISINNVAMYFSNENVTLVNFFQLHHHFSNTWHWPLRWVLRSCDSTSKIILHRIISVVWLTNFLSEILNLTNPRWWVEQQVLSVKRCRSSLEILHIDDRSSSYQRSMEGPGAVWVVLLS